MGQFFEYLKLKRDLLQSNKSIYKYIQNSGRPFDTIEISHEQGEELAKRLTLKEAHQTLFNHLTPQSEDIQKLKALKTFISKHLPLSNHQAEKQAVLDQIKITFIDITQKMRDDLIRGFHAENESKSIHPSDNSSPPITPHEIENLVEVCIRNYLVNVLFIKAGFVNSHVNNPYDTQKNANAPDIFLRDMTLLVGSQNILHDFENYQKTFISKKCHDTQQFQQLKHLFSPEYYEILLTACIKENRNEIEVLEKEKKRVEKLAVPSNQDKMKLAGLLDEQFTIHNNLKNAPEFNSFMIGLLEKEIKKLNEEKTYHKKHSVSFKFTFAASKKNITHEITQQIQSKQKQLRLHLKAEQKRLKKLMKDVKFEIKEKEPLEGYKKFISEKKTLLEALQIKLESRKKEYVAAHGKLKRYFLTAASFFKAKLKRLKPTRSFAAGNTLRK